MRRLITIFAVAVLILSTGSVRADLIVQDYLGNVQTVVLDTATGYHWYADLTDFTNMTLEEQTSEISGLGNYGGINGGWHMADTTEMEGLWSYDSEVIAGAFEPTFGENKYGYYADWEGRYNSDSLVGSDHYWALIDAHVGFSYYKSPIETYCNGFDDWRYAATGAWVTTHNAVVPVPSAVLLGILGLGAVGFKLRKFA